MTTCSIWVTTFTAWLVKMMAGEDAHDISGWCRFVNHLEEGVDIETRCSQRIWNGDEFFQPRLWFAALRCSTTLVTTVGVETKELLSTSTSEMQLFHLNEWGSGLTNRGSSRQSYPRIMVNCFVTQKAGKLVRILRMKQSVPASLFWRCASLAPL